MGNNLCLARMPCLDLMCQDDRSISINATTCEHGCPSSVGKCSACFDERFGTKGKHIVCNSSSFVVAAVSFINYTPSNVVILYGTYSKTIESTNRFVCSMQSTLDNGPICLLSKDCSTAIRLQGLIRNKPEPAEIELNEALQLCKYQGLVAKVEFVPNGLVHPPSFLNSRREYWSEEIIMGDITSMTMPIMIASFYMRDDPTLNPTVSCEQKQDLENTHFNVQ
jgi:hypothetical protein